VKISPAPIWVRVVLEVDFPCQSLALAAVVAVVGDVGGDLLEVDVEDGDPRPGAYTRPLFSST
jgi:hypothetical protein